MRKENKTPNDDMALHTLCSLLRSQEKKSKNLTDKYEKIIITKRNAKSVPGAQKKDIQTDYDQLDIIVSKLSK